MSNQVEESKVQEVKKIGTHNLIWYPCPGTSTVFKNITLKYVSSQSCYANFQTLEGKEMSIFGGAIWLEKL